MSKQGAEGQLAQRNAINAVPSLAPRVPNTPANNADGYWNFIAAGVFLLFVFYITANGSLKAWLNILVWNPAAAPKAVGAQQTPAGTPVGNAPAVAPTAPSTSGLFGQSPGISGQTGTFGQGRANQLFNYLFGLGGGK
jgi:hypothetical protein